MILERKYSIDGTYTSFDFRYYQLVFEHNLSENSKCFESVAEARDSQKTGRFSILYDLNNTKYLMKDNFRHFIIEYPEIQLINSWKQINSPTDEIEVPGQTKAIGFSPQVTEAPMKQWGGLVRTNILDNNYGVIFSYLDGHPGVWTWYFTIGLLCQTSYNSGGIPVNSQYTVNKVSLWSATKEYPHSNNAKCSCFSSVFRSSMFELSTFIFICI
ncbi:hypothetical protein TVAG_028210 [Trichomonas vaginalis G3]|uniref:Uncharacterized protein n=1 Tax=Trichomonas vaginalis (strain ATCC PRA-98 / G3) TaxID=412133 RepID=A2E560_TRIV3|nr:hypothetical protein TVAGG3_0419490 [Trichomonas vaginalis G3]EAY12268.1 hypothetical protein TVAG_028210 [Trichomonas vaginalis G3]KAI5535943.1 hypothetical protein TVAGG3_0419490 [Trichomonas vaginalis G3]|eukprot:XP_001324491.1 hypothetical protein [Trichomonas vaginalis G3]